MNDPAETALFERGVAHAVVTYQGAALEVALDELGWHDALAVDPRLAIATLSEQLGRAGSTSAALGVVVAREFGVDRPVLWPVVGCADAPGSVTDGVIAARGLLGPGNEPSGGVVVATAGGAAFEVPSSAIDRRAVSGLDPDARLVEATLTCPRHEAHPVTGDWAAAVRVAHLALGYELVGASRTMLEFARVHALDRIQFDRPIAMFQAVRHRLAESLVAIEAADALLDAAWLDGSAVTAAMAKATAGRSARIVARHAQQVLAGIGFTTEHPLGRFVRRTITLDSLFGGAAALTAALGRQVTDHGVPPLLPL